MSEDDYEDADAEQRQMKSWLDSNICFSCWYAECPEYCTCDCHKGEIIGNDNING